jgi:hypothetical protein
MRGLTVIYVPNFFSSLLMGAAIAVILSAFFTERKVMNTAMV